MQDLEKKAVKPLTHTKRKRENQVVFWCKAMIVACVLSFTSSYIFGSERKKIELKKMTKIFKETAQNLDVALKERTLYVEDLVPHIKRKKDLTCLNLNAFNEATNKSRLLMGKDTQYITSSVLGRAKDSGQSICEAVYSKCGKEKKPCYSWVGKEGHAQTDDEAKIKNPVKYGIVSRINEAILSGRLKFPQDVRWYVNNRVAPNSWQWKKYKQGEFDLVDTVGDHHYFKRSK